ncbi:helix-turn-helix domain-containing protein [Micromonospora sp. RTGN7]|uniref:helix-turn-helix domain-containing protein n=1 Tax=Micromonospora sp. RTGN7 TaxID=3016526 RepID=UPI0029FF0E8A|nr:helix-turn-helix domain-containing protein [Micromonospora sp. RTGN7]
MDELPIGRRVAYWRGRRKMSQQQFADVIGKSKSWVDKVERGLRSLDKLSTLQAVADGLRVDLRLLLGRDVEVQRPSSLLDNASVDAVRGALARWGPVRPGRQQSAPDLADLRKAVNHAWLSYQHARYADLLRHLPGLLHVAQQARMANPGVTEAAQRLAEAYQIASAVLRKVGVADLAWLAADRALTASQDTDDELLMGACAVQLGYALLSQGQPRHAMELGLTVADLMAAPNPLDASAAHLSVYGTLLIVAARGAAARGDADCVADLLEQVGEAAAVGDGRDHYRTVLSPITVDLARVATTVDLGEGATLDPAAHQRLIEGAAFRRLPPGYRAAYLLDAASGWAQAGDLLRSGRALVDADRTAPAEVRHRPVGHELLATLLRRTRVASADVLRLAEAMGVGV